MTKKCVVEVLQTQIENKQLEMKPCQVLVLKLQESKGHYQKSKKWNKMFLRTTL